MKKQSKQKRTKKLTLKKQFKRTLTAKESVTAFRPTPQIAAHWFRKLNQMLFGNRLRGVEIRIKKLHHDWGRCIVDWDNRKCRAGTYNQNVIPYHVPLYYRIELHCKFKSWKDFIETLAHEMVHLYQMQVFEDPYSNHNDNFYAFRSKFKRLGLKLYR